MLRFLKQSILLVAALFVAYTLVLVLLVQVDHQGQLGHNAIFPRSGNGHSLTRFQELDTMGAVDVLVVGSSHAYRSFDSRMFAEQGLRMFNMGSSSQTPIQTVVLLKAYLQQLQPKTVIWVVNPDVFRSDGVEASVDLTANLPWSNVSAAWLWQTQDLRVFNALYYRWLSHFTENWKAMEQKAHSGPDTYIAGGYVLRSGHQEARPAMPLPTTPLKNKQVAALVEGELLLENTPVLYVETPVTQDYYGNYQQRGEYEHLFENRIFFNANNHFTYPNRFFYDGQHLNAQGVEKFFFDLKEILRLN